MERITRARMTFLLVCFCLIIGAFALHLYNLQIIQPDGDTDNVKKFYTVTRVKAARGDILDRNGNVLVTNRATYDLVFNHFVIVSTTNTNEHLLRLVHKCQELGVEYIDHFPITMEAPFSYTLSELSSSWQGHFQAYLPVVAGGLDSDISAPVLMRTLREYYDIPDSWSDNDARAVIGIRYELRLRQGISNLSNYVFMEDVDNRTLAGVLELGVPGLNTEESMVRVYNTEYAAHILGYIGQVTAEQWNQIYKDKAGYEKDTLVGQSGFEEAFEEYLHGTDGYRVDVTAVDGTLLDQYYQKDPITGAERRPQSGKNVELTIDLNLQTTAEEQMAALITALRNTVDDTPDDGKIPDGSDIEGGAVVMLDVQTGQVLACASYPTYNLSTFRDDWDELKDAEFAPLYNRALLATYVPGSTYKMNMVVASMNAGLVTPNTLIKDKGVFDKYDGFEAKCLRWSKYSMTHGDLNAATALRYSCNYYFYDIADRIDWDLVDMTAKYLGLGEASGVELYERVGYRANAETKKILYKDDPDRNGWYPADRIMASIGQSDNRFTPMQMCVYASVLANRGTRYKATFLNRVVSSDYQSLEYVNESVILSQFAISDNAYAAYTQGMWEVANVEGGTAYEIFKNYPITVAAKTGTAETDSGGSDNGAFVCYAPFDNPRIAIAVYGEKAGHGSTMGQIAKALLDTYFESEIVGDLFTGENEVS